LITNTTGTSTHVWTNVQLVLLLMKMNRDATKLSKEHLKIALMMIKMLTPMMLSWILKNGKVIVLLNFMKFVVLRSLLSIAYISLKENGTASVLQTVMHVYLLK